MGRYTTVQAYADNNPNMRSVSYDQATGKTEPSSSTAGAGGKFLPIFSRVCCFYVPSLWLLVFHMHWVSASLISFVTIHSNHESPKIMNEHRSRQT
mmetsp:Transcript_32524/g.43392  ORF Transcript_32524/g.43392 Transcript_32524/m.43392 type:complete len:96 (+) Transcript_32524:134-421(+)